MRFRRNLAFTWTAGLVTGILWSCAPGAAAPGAAEGEQGDASPPGKTAPASRDAAAADGGAPASATAEVADLHVIGRVDTRDPAGPRFDWPATEIRARFTGTALSLVLGDTGQNQYDVSIDGAPPTLLHVGGAPQTYAVAVGLVDGVHDIRVTKRTESFLGATQLLGVLTAAGGALVPTPAETGRRIELVGDSITCGYGVLGADASCGFGADTESEPLAWGALAAKSLSAARMVVAVSGIGVLRNFAGDTTETMPERYGRALASDPSSTWDDALFAPDVIVVNLGTNDFSDGKGDPGAAFLSAYTDFLAKLRAKNASAWIVASTSPMLVEPDRTNLRRHLENAIEARAAAGDAKVSLLDLDGQLASDGYGCDSHPSKATQQKMAARLVAHLRAVLGW